MAMLITVILLLLSILQQLIRRMEAAEISWFRAAGTLN
jgi:hypothetical protein